MRTFARSLLIVLLFFAAEVKSTQATTLAYYPLGEAGSVGASNIPLDVVNAHDFLNPIGGAAVVGPGAGGAPGSTDALEFVPNDGYYYTATDFVPASDFSIEIWAKVPTIPQLSNFFSLGETGAYLTLGIQNGFWFAGNSGVDYIGADPGTSPAAQAATADDWTKLGLTRTGGLTTFYIDGAAIGSQAGFVALVNGGSKMHLGVVPGGSNYFNGVLDELRISAVPEPTGLTLMGLAFVGMTRFVRRRRS